MKQSDRSPTARHRRGRDQAARRENRTAALPFAVALGCAVLVAAASIAAPKAQTRGGQDEPMPITGRTNASEVMRESRFPLMDVNADGYVTHDEIPDEDRVLKSMFPALDENDDGRLSEPEYVLNGKATRRSGGSGS